MYALLKIYVAYLFGLHRTSTSVPQLYIITTAKTSLHHVSPSNKPLIVTLHWIYLMSKASLPFSRSYLGVIQKDPFRKKSAQSRHIKVVFSPFQTHYNTV